MTDIVVVRSKIKDCVKDCNVSGDFADALDKRVRELINNAETRAKANGRRTVQSRDL